MEDIDVLAAASALRLLGLDKEDLEIENSLYNPCHASGGRGGTQSEFFSIS